MKDNIFELDDGKEYCVVEEVNYIDRNFIMCLECNTSKDEINEKNFQIMEYKIVNNEKIIYNIDDGELLKKVTELLIKKTIN